MSVEIKEDRLVRKQIFSYSISEGKDMNLNIFICGGIGVQLQIKNTNKDEENYL